MNDATLLEVVAEQVHNAWMDAKRAKGVASRKLDTTGEELLVPYFALSEEAKELGRGSVRATLEALGAAGYKVTSAV